MSSEQDTSKVQPLDYGKTGHVPPPAGFPPNNGPLTKTTTTTVVTTIAPGQVYFNELDPYYQTCCCHVRVAVLVIAILDIIGSCSSFFYSVKALSSPYDVGNLGDGFTWFGFISCLVRLTIASLAIVAVKRTMPIFLLPYCIVQGIYVMVILPIVILYTLLLAFGAVTLNLQYYDPYVEHEVYFNQSYIAMVAGILAAVLIISCALGIWFLVVSIRCFKYLKAKQEWFSRVGQSSVTGYQQAAYAAPSYHSQQPGPAYPGIYPSVPTSSQQPWTTQPQPPPAYGQ